MNQKRTVISVILTGMLAASLHAQIGTASLSGTIADATGAGIPRQRRSRCAARLNPSAARQPREPTAQYVIPTLPPGSYQLTVTAAGFCRAADADVRTLLRPGWFARHHDAGSGQSSQITVQESAPVLQTTSASLGAVVSSKQMNELPLLGRSFLNAISLVPARCHAARGLHHESQPGRPVGDAFRCIGQRQKDNNF